MKKIVAIGTLAASIAFCGVGYAYNQEFTNDVHYRKGIISLNSNNYSEAVDELKRALKKYPDVIEIRNNLVDGYYRRGIYRFNKEKQYKAAANDFRAAIFYLIHYKQPTAVELEKVYIIESNLNNCLIKMKKGLDFKSRFQEGQKLKGQGFFAQAVVEFSEASKDQSIRAKSLEYLGDLMVTFSKTHDAAKYYQNVILVDPNNYETHLKFARVLEELGDSDRAIQEYNIAMQGGVVDEEVLPALESLAILNLKKHPENAVSYLNLGAVYQKKHDYITALNYYKKAQKLDSSNPIIKLNIASLHQAQGDYDKAIAIYDEIIKIHPYDKLAHLYRAQANKQNKNYQVAINGFHTVLQIDPKDASAKAELLDTIKNYLPKEQVVKYFQEAADKNPDDETVQFMLANELFKRDMFKEAILRYRKVLYINHQNVNSYINIAKAYQALEDFDSADVILEEGIAKNENNELMKAYKATVAQNKLVYNYKKAQGFYDKGEFEKALSIYEGVESKNKDTYVNIAACYQRLKKYDKSLEYYHKALEQDKTDPSIMYYIGTVHYSKNNFENANVLYKKALALDPENQEIKEAMKVANMAYNNQLLQKGLEQYNTLEYNKALETLGVLLTNDDKSAYGYYYRGLVYDALNKQKLAVKDYLSAIASLQDFDIAYYALAVDYDVLKKPLLAKAAYEKFVEYSKEQNEYTKYAKERILAITESNKDKKNAIRATE